MIDLTVAQIADIVGGTLSDVSPEDAAQRHVTATVEFDSRAVGPGGLFLALPGARSDGHDHAASAVAAGAVAVLAAPPVGVPAIVVAPEGASGSRAGVLEHDPDGSGAAVLAALGKLAKAVAAELVAGGLTIVGITGSSGKTSTKDLVAAVLDPLGEVVAPPGSFNNELGHPWTVLRATADTDYLVLEMSARHPGNIAALAEIAPPSIGVVLNVGTAHLGEFGSRDVIARTKSELPQSVPTSGVVILNVDDPAVAPMADVTAARVVRVSRAEITDAGPSQLWAGPVSLDELARPCFTLHHRDASGTGQAQVRLGVYGDTIFGWVPGSSISIWKVRTRRVWRSVSDTKARPPFSKNCNPPKRCSVFTTSRGSPVKGALSATRRSRFGTLFFRSPLSSASTHIRVAHFIAKGKGGNRRFVVLANRATKSAMALSDNEARRQARRTTLLD